MTRKLTYTVIITIVLLSMYAVASELSQDAESAMKNAVQYFWSKVSTNGGYLWTYSEDLKEREGVGSK